MKRIVLILNLALILGLSLNIFAQKTPAENFTAEALDGRLVELDQLRGKVVVMTFWSTTCLICDAEIPKLNQMVSKYEGRDVVFLGLTVENPTKVENFLKQRPFNFEILPSTFGVLLKYADKDRNGNVVMGFPAYFILNQNGEVELKDSGWDRIPKVDSQIGRLLQSPVAVK